MNVCKPATRPSCWKEPGVSRKSTCGKETLRICGWHCAQMPPPIWWRTSTGGVFASVYGSITLLSEEEKKLIKGIIINKFRGDISLFDEGRKIIHDLTGIPVVGVIPLFQRHLYRRRRLRLTGDQKHQSRERQDQRGHRTPETPFQFHGLQRAGTR